MNVFSLFSGVGGLDLGLENAGMTIVGHCEIDRHARNILARHWPDVPCHDDVTTLDPGELTDERIDVVAGGSPCQDLSVAGRRNGLDGERSGLFWHQCRAATQAAARWVVWENVVGALSSNNGNDFAAVLWGLTGLYPAVPEDGWRSVGVCVGPERTAVWRVFDAQWFGVAQRRRRVFVVAGPGDRCGPEILAVAQSVRGDTRPSRETGEEVAGTLGGGSGSRGWSPDTDRMTFVAFDSHWNGEQILESDVSIPLKVGGDGGQPPAIVFDWTQTDMTVRTDVTQPLSVRSTIDLPSVPAVQTGQTVRRLTPTECERLMGWPDKHTAGQADSHRYKQCGNGVVAPVAEWIGARLIAADRSV